MVLCYDGSYNMVAEDMARPAAAIVRHRGKTCWAMLRAASGRAFWAHDYLGLAGITR